MMPPSGEELILSLLSRSVAKLENGDQKQKPKDEEVTFLKYVKKVKRQTETADKIADIVESLINVFLLERSFGQVGRRTLGHSHLSSCFWAPEGNIHCVDK